MNGPARPSASLLGLAGLVCALLLLLGRWSPARFLGFGVFPPVYMDLRPYLLASGFLLVVLLGRKLYLNSDCFAVAALMGALTLFTLTALAAGSGAYPSMDLRPFNYVAIKAFDALCLIVSLAMVYVLAQDPAFEDSLWTWVFRISLVLTALGVVATLRGTITYEERLTVMGAAGGNFFSRVVGVAAVLGTYHWARGDRPAWGYLAVVAAALSVVALSGSRGGMVATGVGLIAVLLLSSRPGAMLRFTVWGVGAVTVLVLLLPAATLDFLTMRYIDQLAGQLYLARRDIVFEQALAFWRDSRFVGHGLGSFSRISAWEYPHNLFLELLCEFGILGTVIIIAPLLLLVAASLRRWRHLDPRSVAVFAVFCIASQVSGDLYDSRAVFLLPVVMAAGALARQAAASAAGHPSASPQAAGTARSPSAGSPSARSPSAGPPSARAVRR